MKTVLVYGSTLGNCKDAAGTISDLIGDVEVLEISATDLLELPEYDLLILGSSTWGFGDLQDDWDLKINELKKLDLTGKTVALYGTGDQDGYGDTFGDAVGILYEAVSANGATVVGKTHNEGYDFTDSKALEGDSFVGLLLDDDNQSELSKERIENWCTQLKDEMAS